MKVDAWFALYSINCMVLASIVLVSMDSSLTTIGRGIVTLLSVITILLPLHIIEKIQQCNCQC